MCCYGSCDLLSTPGRLKKTPATAEWRRIDLLLNDFAGRGQNIRTAKAAVPKGATAPAAHNPLTITRVLQRRRADCEEATLLGVSPCDSGPGGMHHSPALLGLAPLRRAAHVLPGLLQLVHHLKIEPELGRRAESLTQQNCGFGRDAAVASQDCGDAVGRNAQLTGQGASGETERCHELLAQPVPRRHRPDALGASHVREIDPGNIISADGYRHPP